MSRIIIIINNDNTNITHVVDFLYAPDESASYERADARHSDGSARAEARLGATRKRTDGMRDTRDFGMERVRIMCVR
jgi:hypothetical protein